MNSCKGNGECLFQCECECYNEQTGEYDEICICGHREHDGNCPSNCCKPLKCQNYKYCKVLQPKWISDFYDGMCMNCAIQIEKCCLCLENKNMLILKCGHKICNECICNDFFANEEHCCPLCRILNDRCK